jgi:hypothetical protein
MATVCATDAASSPSEGLTSTTSSATRLPVSAIASAM